MGRFQTMVERKMGKIEGERVRESETMGKK